MANTYVCHSLKMKHNVTYVTLYATAYNFTDYKNVRLLVTKQTLLGLKL